MRRCIDRLVAGLLAVVLLAAAACVHTKLAPLGYELGCAMERDGVLPEGAAWRESVSSNRVCIFGVSDPAAQDRVVEGARESRRRLGRTGSLVTVEFWSGEPPPPGVEITVKEQAPTPGEPPHTETAERNARYGIALVRSVRLDAPPPGAVP